MGTTLSRLAERKHAAVGVALGLALGSAGLAVAYVTAPPSYADGQGSITVPAAVGLTATTVMFVATTIPAFADFTVTNPNGRNVHVGKARIRSVTTADCTRAGSVHSPLVTHTTPTTTVGPVRPGTTAVASTSTEDPSFTLHTTPTYDQSGCTISFTLTMRTR